MRFRSVDVEHVNGTLADRTASIDALGIRLDEPLEGRFVGFTHRFPDCSAFARIFRLLFDGGEPRRSIAATRIAAAAVVAGTLGLLASAEHQASPGFRELRQ